MAGLVFFPGFLLEHLADAGSGCVQELLFCLEPGPSAGICIQNLMQSMIAYAMNHAAGLLKSEGKLW